MVDIVSSDEFDQFNLKYHIFSCDFLAASALPVAGRENKFVNFAGAAESILFLHFDLGFLAFPHFLEATPQALNVANVTEVEIVGLPLLGLIEQLLVVEISDILNAAKRTEDRFVFRSAYLKDFFGDFSRPVVAICNIAHLVNRLCPINQVI